MVPYTLFLMLFFILAASACSDESPDPFREVGFDTADGGRIFANLYGEGKHAVVLAHGKIFDKESWDTFARRLAAEGFRVLAIDFRGYGNSTPGSKGEALHEDILGAIAYLRSEGAAKISVIGGSMGGGAAARAAKEAERGDIDRLILLSPVPVDNPEKMKAAGILYVASREEKLVPLLKDQYEKAPEPKKLELIDGNAHAQHIFKTKESNKLEELILSFLAGP